MSYWFNVETKEVRESDTSPWLANESMGPYETKELAENALLMAAARTANADEEKKAEAGDDEWDREDAEWENNW